jgi:hypothetical protein
MKGELNRSCAPRQTSISTAKREGEGGVGKCKHLVLHKFLFLSFWGPGSKQALLEQIKGLVQWIDDALDMSRIGRRLVTAQMFSLVRIVNGSMTDCFSLGAAALISISILSAERAS